VSQNRSKQLERTRQVRNILLWIWAANWAVAFAKLAFGVTFGISSVTADGLHSLVDGGSNIIGLMAIWVASRPADDDHPYGHEKFEALASLAIGAMVGIGMLELGRMAVGSLFRNHHPEVSPAVAGVMVATLFINLLVARIERRHGQRLKSPLLLADAQHTLSDVFVTCAVLGSLGLLKLGFTWADGGVAILILGFVAYVAYGIVRQAVGILSDTAQLDPSDVAQLVTSVPGVLRCRDVRSRGMQESVYVDLKIEVDAGLPTGTAHAVADEVEQKLSDAFPQIVDVVVHVEPAASWALPH
jgi:cation diffusion facilitator family transporter